MLCLCLYGFMRACMYICKCINIYICVYTWIKCTCTLLSCFFWIVNAIYLDIEILSIKFRFLKPTKYSKSFTNIMLLLFNTKIKTETVESKLAILKNVRYIIRITWSYASSMNELVTMFKTGNTWLIRNHVESYTANLDLLHKYFCRHFARGRCLLSAFVYACVYIFIYAYIYTHTCTHIITYINTYVYKLREWKLYRYICMNIYMSWEQYMNMYTSIAIHSMARWTGTRWKSLQFSFRHKKKGRYGKRMIMMYVA